MFLLVVFPVVVSSSSSSSSSESGANKFGGGVGVTEDLLLFARFLVCVVVCPPRTPIISSILCVFVLNGAFSALWGKKVKQNVILPHNHHRAKTCTKRPSRFSPASDKKEEVPLTTTTTFSRMTRDSSKASASSTTSKWLKENGWRVNEKKLTNTTSRDTIEQAILNMDFIEEEDDSEDEDSDDDERVFLPSVPNKTQEGLKRNFKGPFVWQIVDARDVSRARMNDERKANELDFDDFEEDKEKSTNSRRMLKVTATDGYSEIVILERLGWSSVERARARWERQLTPGTKVLVKDLNEATSGGSALGRTNEDVVFADTDANFQILGGQVQKLKEKFEKKMRMKAASRFADDGFSLGDVGKAPKFQPFDDETWKQFEKERKVKEEELRKEREEAERKEKMERKERERAARKELERERRRGRAGEREEDDDDDEDEEEQEEEEMQPSRAKPRLPPKKGAVTGAPSTPSQPLPVAASNQQQKQRSSKPGNARGSNDEEKNDANALEKEKEQHEILAKRERSKILKLARGPPPPREDDDFRNKGGRGGRGRGQRGGKGDRADETEDDSRETKTLTLDQLRAKKLAEKLDRERFIMPLGSIKASEETMKTGRSQSSETSNRNQQKHSQRESQNLAAQIFSFARPTQTSAENERKEGDSY